MKVMLKNMPKENLTDTFASSDNQSVNYAYLVNTSFKHKRALQNTVKQHVC